MENVILDEKRVSELLNLKYDNRDDWEIIYNALTVEEQANYRQLEIAVIDSKHERKWSLMDKEKKDMSERNFVIDGITSGQFGESFECRLTEKMNKRLLDITNRKEQEKFTFFWETSSVFSQWHESKFIGKTFLWETHKYKKDFLLGLFSEDTQEYINTEQYMMYHKSMLFLDRENAQKIMMTNNSRKIKELGRQVTNFNQDVWEYYRALIVYDANKAKFLQNEHARTILLNTKGTTLVEASPFDDIWGVGISKNDSRIFDRSKWLGQNLLGEILTQIRIEFE